jgi:predicted nucleotidyltransferase
MFGSYAGHEKKRGSDIEAYLTDLFGIKVDVK